MTRAELQGIPPEEIEREIAKAMDEVDEEERRLARPAETHMRRAVLDINILASAALIDFGSPALVLDRRSRARSRSWCRTISRSVG